MAVAIQPSSLDGWVARLFNRHDYTATAMEAAKIFDVAQL